MAAFVVERDEARSEHAIPGRRRGAVVALRIGQGQGVPDRRLDRIEEVLVAVFPPFVAVGQLDLGEEVAAEGLAAQVADLALLAAELLLGLGRRRRTRAGGGDPARLHGVGAVSQAPHPAAEQQDDQKNHEQDHQELVGAISVVVVPVTRLAAATALFFLCDRNEQPRLRRRRRRGHRNHHHR